MTTLCTFSQVTQLREAQPGDGETVTLTYTPVSGERYALLDCGGAGVLAEPAPSSVTQPQRWLLLRTDLDNALAALESSSAPVTIADEGSALVLAARELEFRLAVGGEDTQPVEVVGLQPPIKSLTFTPTYTPPSQAFTIINAAFMLSGALNGAPVVDYDARAGAYRIALAKRLRLSFTATERAATTLTYEVETPAGWKPLTTYRLPKYSLGEFARWLLLLHGDR